MAKKVALTTEEAVTRLRDAVLFILAGIEHYDIIDTVQQKHWIGLLKEIGTYTYKLKAYDGKSFEEILKGGGKK